MMDITELLITGYRGDTAAFAVNLTADRATVVLLETDDRGEEIIKAASTHESALFSTLIGALDQAIVPARLSRSGSR